MLLPVGVDVEGVPFVGSKIVEGMFVTTKKHSGKNVARQNI